MGPVEPFVFVQSLYSDILLLQDDAEEQDHTKLDPRDSYEKPPIYKEDPDLEVPYPLLCGEHVLRIGKTTEAIFILSKYRFFVKYKNSFTNVSWTLVNNSGGFGAGRSSQPTWMKFRKSASTVVCLLSIG